MTAHDAPQQFGHPSTWPVTQPAVDAPPPPGPSGPQRRTGLIAGMAVGALVVAVLAGGGVWLAMRPGPAPAAAGSAAPPATLTVSGVMTLQRTQFSWNSVADPTCQGLSGYADIRPGAQVTVTDAGGKALAVGSLGAGQALGITTEADGTHRASSCALGFKVEGVPAGVGPYGVEVAHRGVLRFNEGELTGIRIGF